MQTINQTNHTTSQIKWATLLITLGIIYGDIGTSPLYVFKAIVGDRIISKPLVFGAVSCVFWTLVIQTSIKYVWLTLKADNQGEGGIFSLYSLIRKYGKKLVIPTMIGACALLADGIITPAVSVTSAIEGLRKVEGLENISVMPIVLVIISIIFFFQRFGSEKVGNVFGPVMFLWFLMLMTLGLIQILQMPSILQSLSPIFAYELLMDYPQGFWLLGAVFLCTTGAEALYSDLGHCGRTHIRITWVWVKMALVINYLGQAAWLISTQNSKLLGKNPFFEIIPQEFLLVGIIVATLAAIIASQALISGSFTLINEAVNLNFWLKVEVKQPSNTKGQIYIPSINFILWLGCMFVVIYFQDSSHMEAAYGLAITIAMLMTTYLLSFYLLYKRRWNKWLVLGVLMIFVVIELSFFVANLVKFKEGGYVTIMVGGIFFLVMYSIYFGRKISFDYLKFIDSRKYIDKIVALSKDKSVGKTATHLVYLTKAYRTEIIEEKIIDSILNHQPKRAEVYWFFHLNRTNEPYTLDYEINEIHQHKIYKIVLNIGFRVQPKTELFFKKILDDMMRNHELSEKLNQNKYSTDGLYKDFKFIITQKYLSVENDFSFRKGLIIKSFFLLKKLGIRDEIAFGLDKSDLQIEQYPFVPQPMHQLNLTRK